MIAFSGATPISVLRRPLYSPGAPSVDSVVEKVLKNPPDVPAAACILIFVASAGYNAAAPEAPPTAPNTNPSACLTNLSSFSF
eukprot:CAMPEP_0177737064 /NCGR_PEP_ID=MMETSP0484_2-20121128/25683_1 /TAXON_ID=354590 /ORGANISM="Rhodomonas lens, Strain RHODO" /LENGTH=82 /DNA_ID=CAMNT_0019250815 /DNA_START=184 /DNA_END=432 /DNA_ORIENTATION=-